MALTTGDGEHHLHSRRNRIGLTTRDERTLAFATELTDLINSGRRRRFSEDQYSECHTNMVCLLLDLLAALHADERIWIGYSRGSPNFVRGGCYWDDGIGQPKISRTYYLNAIDHLAELDLVESVVADPGFGRFSSRVKGTQGLRREFYERGINWTAIQETDAPLVVVKDENRRITSWPDPGTFPLDRTLANLRRINANLATTQINICISDEELRSLNRPRSITADNDEDEEPYRTPIDFSRRSLRRVFAMSSFSNGGRFYGGWWQGIPSRLRRHIEIDGRVTVELDFSTIQPRMLYASIGMEPPEDSYVLPDWGQDFRRVTKKAFSQLLNSDETSRNPKQWHRFSPDLDPDPLPDGWETLSPVRKNNERRRFFQRTTGRDYSNLIADLLRFHAPIEKDFFSGVWGATQNMDSQIVELVLIRLLDEAVPITALPIHDSFLVPRGSEEALRQAMTDAFNDVVDTEVRIDRDEAVFDLPEGEVVDGPINLSGLDEATRAMLETHRGFFMRDEQWAERYGPH